MEWLQRALESLVLGPPDENKASGRMGLHAATPLLE
jgi:hypothetical protein